jgi:hypothetical protein
MPLVPTRAAPPPVQVPSSRACCLLHFSSSTDRRLALRLAPSSLRLCSEPVSPWCPPLTSAVVVTPCQICHRRSPSDLVQHNHATGCRCAFTRTSPMQEHHRHPDQCRGLPGSNGLRPSGHGLPALHCAS